MSVKYVPGTLCKQCDRVIPFGKGTQGRDTTERILGSQAFTAVVRVVWATASMESGDRVLVHPKNNLGSDKGGFKYTVEMVNLQDGIEASKICWGDFINGQAREILDQFENLNDSTDIDRSAITEATNFLIKILELTNLPSKEIYKQAEEAGISKATILRAKKKLLIKAIKTPNSVWLWSLFSQGDQNFAKAFTQNDEYLGSKLNTLDDPVPF